MLLYLLFVRQSKIESEPGEIYTLVVLFTPIIDPIGFSHTRQYTRPKTVRSSAMRAVIVTGTPGSGKTSVAEEMASRMERSAHIPVDFFRKMIKGGYRSPHRWDEEVERQYKLSRRAAADTAVRLAVCGFTPILDDVVAPGWEEEWRIYLLGMQVDIVLLRPKLDVVIERNQARTCWTVEEQVLRDLHAMLGQDYTAKWHRIDNSEGTPADTAELLMAQLGLC